MAIFGPFWCQQQNSWLRFKIDQGRLDVQQSRRSADSPKWSLPWESLELSPSQKYIWTVQDKGKIKTFAWNQSKFFETDWEYSRLAGQKSLVVSEWNSDGSSRHRYSLNDPQHVSPIKSDSQPDPGFYAVNEDDLPLTPEMQAMACAPRKAINLRTPSPVPASSSNAYSDPISLVVDDDEEDRGLFERTDELDFVPQSVVLDDEYDQQIALAVQNSMDEVVRHNESPGLILVSGATGGQRDSDVSSDDEDGRDVLAPSRRGRVVQREPELLLASDKSPVRVALELAVKMAVARAQGEYSRWYNLPFFGQEIVRRKNGFLSKIITHTQNGQDFARDFRRHINESGGDDVTDLINNFLTNPATHYHVHSFATFLLDELSPLKGTPWYGLQVDGRGKYDREDVAKSIHSARELDVKSFVLM
ncbi:hypothetical protein [Legionella sp. CNM-4043-24]|uniref:hypothetical protein n=1 Tax=Legionella sp. CNM-4043-24 TaxID=3421646 RepID=UPI00403B115A